MKLKLMIFDMDGLMFDTEAVAYRAYVDRCKEWGLEDDQDFYLSMTGQNKRDICAGYRRFYGEDMNAEEFYKSVGIRIGEILDSEGVPMKAGLVELLDVLEQLGIPKVIASSSSLSRIRKNLEKAGLTDRFDHLVSSDDMERGKPFPDIFLAACRKQGVKPQDALVLEDSPAGIQAAEAGDIPVVAIPDVLPLTEEIQKKCVLVGESLLDVIPLLKNGI